MLTTLTCLLYLLTYFAYTGLVRELFAVVDPLTKDTIVVKCGDCDNCDIGGNGDDDGGCDLLGDGDRRRVIGGRRSAVVVGLVVRGRGRGRSSVVDRCLV